MSERNQQVEEQTEDLCIHIQGPISFDGENTYIEVPADGEWYHIVFTGDANGVNEHPFDGEIVVCNRALSEGEVEEACHEPPMGSADKVLSPEEIEAIYELLTNHPEIKWWQIRENVLYLKVEEEE